MVIPQIPALIERGTIRAQAFLHKLDRQLGSHAYVAGDAFTMADITALCAVDFAKRVRIEPSQACVHLLRWHAQVSARPSAKA